MAVKFTIIIIIIIIYSFVFVGELKAFQLFCQFITSWSGNLVPISAPSGSANDYAGFIVEDILEATTLLLEASQ